MRERLQNIQLSLRHYWLLAVLFAVCIPLFPEYLAPLMAIAALLCARHDARNHGRTIMIGPLGKILLLYIGYQCIGLIYAKNRGFTLATIVMWVVMLLVYLSLTTVLTNWQRLNTVFFCIAVVAGITGTIGVLQYLLYWIGIPFGLQFWEWFDQVFYWAVDSLGVSLDITGVRVCSTFTNPNIFAEYAIMVTPFLAQYAFDGERSRIQLFCRFSLLMVIGAVAFSFSRGAYLALLVMALIFCIVNIKNILFIVVMAFSIIVLIPPTVYERLMSIGGLDASTVERLHVWNASLEVISKHPFFGTGAGIGYIWDVLNKANIPAPHAHNLVLQLLIEGGVVGLLIMLYLSYQLLQGSVELSSRSKSKVFGVPFIAFAAAFCIQSMVEYPFLTPKLLGTFMLVIALADVVCHQQLRHQDYTLQPLNSIRQRLGGLVLRFITHTTGKKKGV